VPWCLCGWTIAKYLPKCEILTLNIKRKYLSMGKYASFEDFILKKYPYASKKPE